MKFDRGGGIIRAQRRWTGGSKRIKEARTSRIQAKRGMGMLATNRMPDKKARESQRSGIGNEGVNNQNYKTEIDKMEMIPTLNPRSPGESDGESGGKVEQR